MSSKDQITGSGCAGLMKARTLSVIACVLGLSMSVGVSAFNDPTEPSDYQPVVVTGEQAEVIVWQVQAVFLGQSRRHAIINGEQYRVGDKLGAGTITAIGRDGVQVRQGGAVMTLKLMDTQAKTDGEVPAPSATVSE